MVKSMMQGIKSLYDNIVEIKSFGDTVRISLPDPENIILGSGIVADASAVSPTQKTLVIDKSRNVAFKFNDVEIIIP